MRLVAGLHPNPLGELQRFSRSPSWIRGRRVGKGKVVDGKGWKREGKRKGEDPQCLKCVDASASYSYS